MAETHGGYRPPQNPAPVSGPGNLSRRTDGGPADKKQAVRRLPDAGYGEQAEYQGIQQGAPIAKVEPATAPSGAQAAAAALPPPLDAPSGRPGEPVTSGADAGAGVGSDALGLFDPSDIAANDLAYLLKYLPTLQTMHDNTPQPNTSFTAFVRYLRSQV